MTITSTAQPPADDPCRPERPPRWTPCSAGGTASTARSPTTSSGPPTAASTTGSTPTRDTTVHLLAELDGCIVGGVRYCLHDLGSGSRWTSSSTSRPHVRAGRPAGVRGHDVRGRRAEEATASRHELIRRGETWAAELGGVGRWSATVNPAIDAPVRSARLPAGRRLGPHANGLPFVPVVKRLGAGVVHPMSTGTRSSSTGTI